MKNLLVDAAKSKRALKRGAGRTPLQLSDESLGPRSPEDVTLFVHDACQELARREPRAAELAHLHYFGDFTWSQAGDLLGLSVRDRKSLRQLADAWFLKELED